MDERTKAELRRKIAEARALLFMRPDNVWCAIDRDGKTHYGTTADNALGAASEHGSGVPNWPNDPGAALALCLEIARGIDPTQAGTIVREVATDDPEKKYAAHFIMFPFSEDSFSMSHKFGATSAEALARLALSALEANPESAADDD